MSTKRACLNGLGIGIECVCLEMGGDRRRSKMLKESHKLNSVLGKKPKNGCFFS